MSHTPGPWTVLRCLHGWYIGPHPKWVCTVHDDTRPPSSLERKRADVALIAASPDLLDACEQMIANFERWLETGEPADDAESERLFSLMKAAVRKARGK